MEDQITEEIILEEDRERHYEEKEEFDLIEKIGHLHDLMNERLRETIDKLAGKELRVEE